MIREYTGIHLSSLLGSCAFGALALSSMGAANAADLPSHKAAPVSYVKICNAYGAGFFMIPGSDTCVRLGGAARFETQYTPGRNIYNVATGAVSQYKSTQDTTGLEVRGLINADARTPTEYGDARTYFRIRSIVSSGIRSTGGADNFASSYSPSIGNKTGLTLERAFVTWNGITFGNLSSEWAGLWPSGTVVGGGADFTPGWSNGIKAISYAKPFGGGWTVAAAIQDRADTGPNGSKAYTTTDSTKLYPVQLTNMAIDTPTTGLDILGVIRNEGTWGGAEAGLMTGNNSTLTATGSQTYSSWAANATVKINLPMIAAGDYFMVNAGYGVGANGYAGAPDTVNTLVSDSTNRRILGGVIIAPSDIAVTSYNGSAYTYGQDTVRQTTALFTHYWTPEWRTHFSFASSTYKNPTAASTAGTQLGTVNIWATKAYVVYSPAKDFDIGVEVAYGRDNATIQNPTAAFVSLGSPGLNDSNYTAKLRVIRTF